MFFIECLTMPAVERAINLIKQYNVSCLIKVETEHFVVVVEAKEENLTAGEVGDLRLAEMAFQMNYHQKGGFRCGHCDETEGACGHLCFTTPI